MRAYRRNRSIRAWLALTAASAAVASSLAVVGSTLAFAEEAVLTVVPNSGTPIAEVSEGDATPLTRVAKFTDLDNLNCTTSVYQAMINWGDGDSSTGIVVCERTTGTSNLPTGTFDVGASHQYIENGSYIISVSVTDTDENESSGAAVNTDTATIDDAALEVDFDNSPDGPFVKVEGQSLTVSVNFFDNNRAYQVFEGPSMDSGITATINWGDGGAVQTVTPALPPESCDCPGDFVVSAAHVYDAPKEAGTQYTITVKATDDGGATATDTLHAKISDAKLTAGAAKSFVATGGQSSSHVVASFTDDAGAQAAAADFAATIKWGDNTTSAGTVTKTADGEFDVSGSHNYATAGTKTLTITVTDEEGQTLSMTATATVPALPTTGQPKAPAQPSMPLLPLVALVFGLAIAGGTGLVVARRMRL